MDSKVKYSFYIKTDDDAIMYYMELTAYLVGHIGYCDTGSDYVDGCIQLDFSDVVENICLGTFNDEYSPCSVCKEDSNNFYIFLNSIPSDELIKTFQDRIKTNQLANVLNYEIVNVEDIKI